MKYSPQIYARAFTEAIAEGDVKPEEAIERLVALARKHGDAPHFQKIVAEAERMILKQSGARKVVIETARPLPEEKLRELRGAFSERDVVLTAVRPELVAGARLTVDGEWMIDATVAGKLRKLFKT